MWMRYAAFAAPVLLVAALAAAIVLTSDAGPQSAVAATVTRQGGGAPGAAPPPDSQATPVEPCENGAVVPSPAGNPGLVTTPHRSAVWSWASGNGGNRSEVSACASSQATLASKQTR